MKGLLHKSFLMLQLAALWIKDLVTIIRSLYVPLFLSIFTFFVLSRPLQSTEYYRSLVELLAYHQTILARNLTSPDGGGRNDIVCFLNAKLSTITNFLGTDFGESTCFFGNALPEAIDIFGVSFASLLLMTICFYFIAALTIAERDWTGVFKSRHLVKAIHYVPWAAASAPLFAVCYGMTRSRYSVNLIGIDRAKIKLEDINDTYSIQYIESLIRWSDLTDNIFHHVIIISVILFGTISYGFFQITTTAFSYFSRNDINIWPIVRVTLLASITLTFAGIVAVAIFPVTIGRELGAISIVCIFFSLLSLNVAGLNFLARRIDFPIFAALVSVAIIFSIANLNDNHQLSRIDKRGQRISADEISGVMSQGGDLPLIGNEFEAWYLSRMDKDNPEFLKSGYPVYIVAAQGGGIYAAAQTLLFLTRMHVACPRFGQHVFAISSVSGGSVGAAFYEALSGRFQQTKDQCPSADEVIKNPRVPSWLLGNFLAAATDLVLEDFDFLSPLVAAALFPDFAQRFIVPPIPALSRARALEQAIEEAWEGVSADLFSGADSDALRRGILASWKSDGIRPALVVNTTEVGSGRRRVITPFKITSRRGSDMKMLPISRGFDVPISAAAVASASFPWITPAAWFIGESDHQDSNQENALKSSFSRKRRWLVDGGYFDNSGVATAIDIIDSIDEVLNRYGGKVQINLIVITSGAFSDKTTNPMGEIASPFLALYNSRQARTYSTIELAERRLGYLTVPSEGDFQVPTRFSRLHQVRFDDFMVPLPLGWRLSQLAASQIFYQTGSPRRCMPDGSYQQTYEGPGFGPPDCVQLLLLHQLRGDDLEKALLEDVARFKQ